MIKSRLCILVCLLSTVVVFGQNIKLADSYFDQGEYEKASDQYNLILTKSQAFDSYAFERMIECIQMTDTPEKAIGAIEVALKNRPQELSIYFVMAKVLEQSNQLEDAGKWYDKILDKAKKSPEQALAISFQFIQAKRYEYAEQIILHAMHTTKNVQAYNSQLIQIYRLKKDQKRLIVSFLNSSDCNINNIVFVRNFLNREVEEEGYDLLKEELLSRMLQDPDNVFYPELLGWSYLQQKDYNRALKQSIALDLKLNESGQRVYDISQSAMQDKHYDAAIVGYQYIIDNKDHSNRYFVIAKTSKLKAKRLKIIEGKGMNYPELQLLKQEYISYLNELGWNRNTAPLCIELAELEALYLEQADSAIIVLERLLEISNLHKDVRANIKLALGDYYLITSDQWEASLLYSQVDKDYKEGVLGENARYKSALLFYFIGQFEWSQAQFGFLKSATTKLISNDAIDRSVFIMDILNTDTSTQALEYFSTSELMIAQHRYAEAELLLDTVLQLFPDNILLDDVLYLKAQIARKNLKFDEAVTYYQKILAQFKEEIKADNALFEWAEIEENIFNNKSKAKELYEKLFLEYSSSTYSIEARKKFRQLRQDNLN